MSGNIMQYNGSALVAMAGKDCIAIASDTRFGIQQQTVATNLKKIFKMTDDYVIGMTGLISDMQTMVNKLQYRLNIYQMEENREMPVRVFSHVVSQMLYEKRFGPYFCEPIIAGLEWKTDETTGEKVAKPFLSGMDLIGAPVFIDSFLCAGTTSDELHGVCEAMYKPDLDADQLFEVISQCLMAGQDRDCLAGWGAVVHVITKDGVRTAELQARMD
eukprot:UN01600